MTKTDNANVTIGDRIKALREQAGLSQSELAELCDVATPTIGHTETMLNQSIKWELLKKIASVLTETGTPEELFKGVDLWLNEDKPVIVAMSPEEQTEFQLFLKWKAEREQALNAGKNGNRKRLVERQEAQEEDEKGRLL